MREIAEVFEELETLLKNDEAGAELSERGVNIALALTAVSGLRAYLAGDTIAAIEDLSTAVEEIASRAGTPELPRLAEVAQEQRHPHGQLGRIPSGIITLGGASARRSLPG